MKSLGLYWRASFTIVCASFLASCGASDSDEPHQAGGGSSGGRATSGGSGGTAGSSGQVTTGGTSGAVTGGAPSGGASGAGAAVAGGGMGGGAGRPATGGMSGADAGSGGSSGGAGRGGSSGGAGRGGSSGGGAPGWTCENLGAEICFCRLGGEPLAGPSCTGSWNCCFVTGTAERGNCQCFDTASDAECAETVAAVMGTRADACPP